MKKFLKNIKNKKGFTLIEIIVVLVILAILAAALIPTMLGFIDDAKAKASIANANMLKSAGAVVGTQYGGTCSIAKTVGNDVDKAVITYTPANGTISGKAETTFDTLVSSDIVKADGYKLSIKDGQIEEVKYYNADSKTEITIDMKAKNTSVDKLATPPTY